MFKILKTDLRKAFSSSEFYLALVGVCVLNFMNLFDEMRIHTVKEYCFVLYLYEARHALGAFSILILFLCALPFGANFCSEWNHGNTKYNLIRTSKNKYGWSKVIVTALTGFLACQIGYMLLIYLLDLYFPLYPTDLELLDIYIRNSSFKEIARAKKYYYFFISTLPESFSFGFLAVVALYVSSKITNTFVVLSAPILFYYGWNFLCGTLRFPYILCWPSFMYRGIDTNLGSGISLLFTMLYYLIGIIIVGALFVKNIKRRIENA